LLHIFGLKSKSILEHAKPNQTQAVKWTVNDPTMANLMDLYNELLDPGSFSFNPVNKNIVSSPTAHKVTLQPLNMHTGMLIWH